MLSRTDSSTGKDGYLTRSALVITRKKRRKSRLLCVSPEECRPRDKGKFKNDDQELRGQRLEKSSDFDCLLDWRYQQTSPADVRICARCIGSADVFIFCHVKIH